MLSAPSCAVIAGRFTEMPTERRRRPHLTRDCARADVLNGYNYVIKHDSAKLDVIIFAKSHLRKKSASAHRQSGLIPLRQRGAAAYRATRDLAVKS
jgi:hypothetical protein